jgi:hypothetical protein
MTDRAVLAYRVARAINRGHEPYAPYVGELIKTLGTPRGVDSMIDILQGMRDEWSEVMARTEGEANDRAVRVYHGLVQALQELEAIR